MTKKKKIPCRVCGKLFEPCAYCQSHADVFRWRNFACSRECAVKYINDTIAYRNSTKNNAKAPAEVKQETAKKDYVQNENVILQKKVNKKASTDIIKT